MSRMQQPNGFNGPPPQRMQRPPRRRRRIRWYFRRGLWIGMPLLCLFFLVVLPLLIKLLAGFHLDGSGLLDGLGIRDHSTFTRLLLWAVTLIAIVGILRLLRGK